MRNVHLRRRLCGEEIVRFYENAFAPALKIVAKAVVLTSHHFSRILRAYSSSTTLCRYLAGGFPSAFLNIVMKAVTDS
jgi:hypothetical protein